jgi:hypothetical protein
MNGRPPRHTQHAHTNSWRNCALRRTGSPTTQTAKTTTATHKPACQPAQNGGYMNTSVGGALIPCRRYRLYLGTAKRSSIAASRFGDLKFLNRKPMTEQQSFMCLNFFFTHSMRDPLPWIHSFSPHSTLNPFSVDGNCTI